jgi:hypothetical protein
MGTGAAIAVQSSNEATFESRCRSLLTRRCAYPGTACMINFLESRIKRKNCDKKMNFIVRVIKRWVINLSGRDKLFSGQEVF